MNRSWLFPVVAVCIPFVGCGGDSSDSNLPGSGGASGAGGGATVTTTSSTGLAGSTGTTSTTGNGGSFAASTSAGGTSSSTTSSATSSSSSGTGGSSPGPYGNPSGSCPVPAAGQPEDVSQPTTVVGNGTPASCTSDKVVAAIHGGGVVTFSCGAAPLTITVPQIDIFNNGGKTKDGSVTIDGGGLITLSGGGANRILYQNTCDQNLVWTTPTCNTQTVPHLVVQNIAFTAGKGDADKALGLLGGGALYVGGGTFKAVNIRVSQSSQPTLGQDNAGGAIYTFNQTKPVYIVSSTFDNNSGSNGGAFGSIGTAWTILNSLFTGNSAVGNGENPAKPGTPGGGLGGAIYNDGNDYTLTICGTALSTNKANELGSGSIFQVVDNLKGELDIDHSAFTGNSNNGSVQSATHPSIYVEAKDKVGNAGVNIATTTFN